MTDKFMPFLEKMPPISLDDMEQVRLMNRLDTKYLATEGQLYQLLQMVQNDYMVLKADGQRITSYHTTYFDDAAHTMYLQHHNGHLCRQKVRVRSYNGGATFFEVKLKDNHGRTRKKRIEIGSPDTMMQDGAPEFLAGIAMLPIPLADMKATVENFFERITLVNLAKTERLTIDVGLSFHNLETDLSRSVSPLVVIEVKRDGNVYSPIVDILRELRIRKSGFSKYCIGSALTNPELKKNRFKKRIRKVNKMTGYDD